jgi:hypothetical protein
MLGVLVRTISSAPYTLYVGVPCQEDEGERSRTGLSWTALLVPVSLRGPFGLARRVRRGAVMLICAGSLPQDEVFGWRGAAGLGMSGVTGR